MQKNILFLANSSSIHAAKWINYFIKKNYTTHLITFSNINNTLSQNIHSLYKKPNGKIKKIIQYILAIRYIHTFLKKENPSHIIAHFSYSMGIIAYLSTFFLKKKPKIAVVCHGSDVLSPPQPKYLYHLLNKIVFSQSSYIYAVSKPIYRILIHKFSIPKSKIFLGQYGIDTNEFKTVSPSILKRDIDIISTRPNIPNSQINKLLEVVNKKEFLNKNIVFILHRTSSEEKKLLEKQFPHITFYQRIPHKKVIELLERSKVYISATKSDGTSLSLLEAMYAGTLPIVSNISANQEWIKDGKNGYLFSNFKECEVLLKKYLYKTNTFYMQKNRENIQKKANYSIQMNKIEYFLQQI